MKSFSALSAVAVSLAVFNVVSAVHLETKEFKRLIPADRLRGKIHCARFPLYVLYTQ